jgi:hypothetical protein
MRRGAHVEFIDPMYLPEGIELTQFHHFQKDEANSLLDHWATRQDAGAASLRFKSTTKATRHGKRPAAAAAADGAEIEEDKDSPENNGDNSSDDGSSDQGEEDATGNACSVSWLPKLGGGY